jgi:adenylate cyclase class 1
MEAYESLATPEKSLYIINLYNAVNVPKNQRNKQGLNLVSSRNDPLAFGSQRENMIFSVDVLNRNSWHETTYHRYSGESAVLRLLQDAFTKKLENPQWEFRLRNYSGSNARIIEQRLKQLIEQILEIKEHQIPARFIWNQGNYFQLLGINENIIEPCMFDAENDLLKVLSYPDSSTQFVHTRFDKNIDIDSPLNLISNHAEAGKLKIYFHKMNNTLKIWLSDEVGAIGCGEQTFDDKLALLRTYQIFLSSVAQRQKLETPEQFLYQADYFDLKLSQGKWKTKPINLSDAQLPIDYYPVQVLIEDVHEEGQLEDLKAEQISIYCREQEFSGLNEGNNLFKSIARQVKSQRKDNSQYPIYITDLDLSVLHRNEPCSTIRYLEYKWYLEKLLNQALRELQ